MDTSGKTRVKTLRKSLAQIGLLRQLVKFAVGQFFMEPMQPIAEVSPLLVLLEILKQPIDVSLESLELSTILLSFLLFVFLH